MTIEVLDPTYDDQPNDFVAAPRVESVAGLTVGLLSNGKQGTAPFFDALERELRRRYGVTDVVRVTKGNYSAPAEREIMDAAGRWHALIAGIGD